MARQQTLDLFIEVRILAGQRFGDCGFVISDYTDSVQVFLSRSRSAIPNPKSKILFGLIV